MFSHHDFGDVIRLGPQRFGRIAAREHDFGVLRLGVEKIEDILFVDDARGDRAHDLVEHDEIVLVGVVDDVPQTFFEKGFRRLLFFLGHLEDELVLQLTGYDVDAEFSELIEFGRRAGLQELHEADVQITAARTDRESDRGGRLTLAVAAIDVNQAEFLTNGIEIG